MMSDPQAGEALDRTMAEKVMGWTWGRAGEDYMGWCGAPFKCVNARHGYFFPTTAIDDAWLVVERLAAMGITLAIRYQSSQETEVEVFPPDCREFSVLAETAPLAICRAAMAAFNRVSDRAARE
jgi:hypothetical protein